MLDDSNEITFQEAAVTINFFEHYQPTEKLNCVYVLMLHYGFVFVCVCMHVCVCPPKLLINYKTGTSQSSLTHLMTTATSS